MVLAGGVGALMASAVACGQIAPQPRAATPAAGQQGGAVPAVAPATEGGTRANASSIAPVPGPASVPYFAQGGLTVVGDGQARGEPDVAYVSAGVQTQAQTAGAAQDANTKAMTDVLAKLKGMGIAANDIRTSGVSLHPVYDRQPNQVTGYVANNSVTVTVQDVTRAGAVLDAAITSGANQSAGVQFGFKDDAPLRRQAAEAAVKAARVRADAIAAAAGLRVTGIISIVDEGGSGGGPRPLEAVRSAAPMAAAAPADVPLQPGQLAVTARVQVVYQLG
jgi:hypothetical protein